MKRRWMGLRLAAVLTVGGLMLPTAAPLVCDLAVNTMPDMEGMAQQEHARASSHWGTPTVAATCVSVSQCVAPQLGFSVTRVVIETRVDLLVNPDTPSYTFFLGRTSAPPTPPPKA